MKFYIRPPRLPDLPEINPEEIKKAGNSKRVKKYTEKYRLAKENNAKKMADQIADEKRGKRRKFIFKFLDAVAIALITLAVEHGVPLIVSFFHVSLALPFIDR